MKYLLNQNHHIHDGFKYPFIQFPGCFSFSVLAQLLGVGVACLSQRQWNAKFECPCSLFDTKPGSAWKLLCMKLAVQVFITKLLS